MEEESKLQSGNVTLERKTIEIPENSNSSINKNSKDNLEEDAVQNYSETFSADNITKTDGARLSQHERGLLLNFSGCLARSERTSKRTKRKKRRRKPTNEKCIQKSVSYTSRSTDTCRISSFLMSKSVNDDDEDSIDTDEPSCRYIVIKSSTKSHKSSDKIKKENIENCLAEKMEPCLDPVQKDKIEPCLDTIKTENTGTCLDAMHKEIIEPSLEAIPKENLKTCLDESDTGEIHKATLIRVLANSLKNNEFNQLFKTQEQIFEGEGEISAEEPIKKENNYADLGEKIYLGTLIENAENFQIEMRSLEKQRKQIIESLSCSPSRINLVKRDLNRFKIKEDYYESSGEILGNEFKSNIKEKTRGSFIKSRKHLPDSLPNEIKKAVPTPDFQGNVLSEVYEGEGEKASVHSSRKCRKYKKHLDSVLKRQLSKKHTHRTCKHLSKTERETINLLEVSTTLSSITTSAENQEHELQQKTIQDNSKKQFCLEPNLHLVYDISTENLNNYHQKCKKVLKNDRFSKTEENGNREKNTESQENFKDKVKIADSKQEKNPGSHENNSRDELKIKENGKQEKCTKSNENKDMLKIKENPKQEKNTRRQENNSKDELKMIENGKHDKIHGTHEHSSKHELKIMENAKQEKNTRHQENNSKVQLQIKNNGKQEKNIKSQENISKDELKIMENAKQENYTKLNENKDILKIKESPKQEKNTRHQENNSRDELKIKENSKQDKNHGVQEHSSKHELKIMENAKQKKNTGSPENNFKDKAKIREHDKQDNDLVCLLKDDQSYESSLTRKLTFRENCKMGNNISSHDNLKQELKMKEDAKPQKDGGSCENKLKHKFTLKENDKQEKIIASHNNFKDELKIKESSKQEKDRGSYKNNLNHKYNVKQEKNTAFYENNLEDEFKMKENGKQEKGSDEKNIASHKNNEKDELKIKGNEQEKGGGSYESNIKHKESSKQEKNTSLEKNIEKDKKLENVGQGKDKKQEIFNNTPALEKCLKSGQVDKKNSPNVFIINNNVYDHMPISYNGISSPQKHDTECVQTSEIEISKNSIEKNDISPDKNTRSYSCCKAKKHNSKVVGVQKTVPGIKNWAPAAKKMGREKFVEEVFECSGGGKQGLEVRHYLKQRKILGEDKEESGTVLVEKYKMRGRWVVSDLSWESVPVRAVLPDPSTISGTNFSSESSYKKPSRRARKKTKDVGVNVGTGLREHINYEMMKTETLYRNSCRVQKLTHTKSQCLYKASSRGPLAFTSWEENEFSAFSKKMYIHNIGQGDSFINYEAHIESIKRKFEDSFTKSLEHDGRDIETKRCSFFQNIMKPNKILKFFCNRKDSSVK